MKYCSTKVTFDYALLDSIELDELEMLGTFKTQLMKNVRSNFKNSHVTEINNKQIYEIRSVIRFLRAKRIPPVDIHCQLMQFMVTSVCSFSTSENGAVRASTVYKNALKNLSIMLKNRAKFLLSNDVHNYENKPCYVFVKMKGNLLLDQPS